MNLSLETYIRQIPKAELHVHIEGTLQPELMFQLAARNGVELSYNSVEEVHTAYRFGNLQEFLDIYYAGAAVLLHEEDFYDLTMDYLSKSHADNVVHTEIFFDPQTHTERGVAFETAFNGIYRALREGESQWGITSHIILCFLRHLDEASAIRTLTEALPYRDKFLGVGLDSSEIGNPPSKFQNVFRMAEELGFRLVAHAGEEAPSTYIREALELLHAERIDHGIQSIHDDALLDVLRDRRIPLTVCPLSNLKLQVVSSLSAHPLKQLLERGVKVTINSDDPAYFGGYMNENFLQTAEALNLSRKDILQLAENAFNASFISEKEKENYIQKLHTFDVNF